MTIFLTGAFGNIGRSTLDGLLERGLQVRTFDLPTHANLRAARAYMGRIETTWGDLRQVEDLYHAAVTPGRIETAIHLGFVIPHLSATGVNSEDQPEFARQVNIGGTGNMVAALQEIEPRPRLIFASSLHVYGRTQHLPPPRCCEDPPNPVEHYACHKVEAEEMVRASGLPWTILRIGAALPVRLILDPGMFNVPLDNRIEFVHTRDAGHAFAEAVCCREAVGKVLLLGGGPRCQMFYRDMMERVMDAVGVGPLPERCFTRVPYSVDWLDTRESQSLLHFQQRTFDDYIADLCSALGGLCKAARMLRPLVRRWLVSRSPYAKSGISSPNPV